MLARVGADIRVLVVDDDDVARRSVTTFLGRREGFVVVGSVENGALGVEAYASNRPDIALMDLNMPVMSGVAAIGAIRALDSQACIVALTTFEREKYVVAALRAGAAGYLVKDSSPEEIVSGLRGALEGDLPLSASIRHLLVKSVLKDTGSTSRVDKPLVTPRQAEVLDLLGKGMTNRQIAAQLHLSEGSIKQYLAAASRRLQATNRTHLLIRAVQLGIVGGGHP